MGDIEKKFLVGRNTVRIKQKFRIKAMSDYQGSPVSYSTTKTKRLFS